MHVSTILVCMCCRQGLLKQKGCVIWFTGLSGSGKSTLAYTLEHALIDRGHLAYVLDGDNVRHGLNKNLGFRSAGVSWLSVSCNSTNSAQEAPHVCLLYDRSKHVPKASHLYLEQKSNGACARGVSFASLWNSSRSARP